ncbi:MAG: toprim domain-containing protein [Nitrospinaceae bacterium]
MAKPDISIVVAGLTDRIGDLVVELLPKGRRHGHEWRCGSLAGEAGQSLAVNIGPSRPGVWCDFTNPSVDKGDAFDLVAKQRFGGDKRRALAWSISWLGLDDMDPGRIKKNERDIKVRKDKREDESRKERMKKRRKAHAIWMDANPDIIGTPVDLYLQGRGVDLSRLDHLPGAIRFAPSLYEPSTKKNFPAMVTSINGVKGNFAAVHRTWLHIEPGGQVVKAPVADPKMVLGSFKGGCIRLWRGERVNEKTGEIKRGLSWGQIKADGELMVFEGIEDALTAAMVRSELRIAVGVTVGHLSLMMLPACFSKITIVADNDAPESRAAKELETAVKNFQNQGLKVFLIRPPEGFKDINEMLTKEK